MMTEQASLILMNTINYQNIFNEMCRPLTSFNVRTSNDHGGVYVICDRTTGQYYIGQSVHVYRRLYEHFYLDRSNKVGASLELRQRYLKHDRFDVVIFKAASTSFDDLERTLITYFGQRHPLFNRMRGNHGSRPKQHWRPRIDGLQLSKHQPRQPRHRRYQFKYHERIYQCETLNAICKQIGCQLGQLNYYRYYRHLSLQVAIDHCLRTSSHPKSKPKSKVKSNSGRCKYQINWRGQIKVLNQAEIAKLCHVDHSSISRQYQNGHNMQAVVDHYQQKPAHYQRQQYQINWHGQIKVLNQVEIAKLCHVSHSSISRRYQNGHDMQAVVNYYQERNDRI